MAIMKRIGGWNAREARLRRTGAEVARSAPRFTGLRQLALVLVLMSAVLGSTIHSAPLRARQLRYQVGRTYHYDYSVTINTTSASRDAKGVRQDQGQTMVIEAVVNVTITGIEADGNYVGELSLQYPSLHRTDGTTIHPVNDVATLNALQIPLRFKQAKNGVITAVSAPADAPIQVVNIQKGVLNALQVTLLEGNTYVASENAGQGALQVQYTLKELGRQLQISKRYDQDSFDRLVTSGASNRNLKLQNQIEMVLDEASGVIAAVSYEEQIATGDGAAPADADGNGFDGVTAWSMVNATGSLKLRDVVKATTKSKSGAAYVADSLEGKLTGGAATRHVIDLTTIDVRSELGRFEKEPGNPAHHARIVALAQAAGDRNDHMDVLGSLAARLTATVANEAVAAAYVDVLGSVATPRAQGMLAAVLGNAQADPALAAVQFSAPVREQALLSVVRVNAPTSTMVQTVEELAKRPSEMRETAITVLGAVAGRLTDANESEARRLVRQLEAELAAAQTPADIELYLNAVGNAGLPSSVEVIARYVDAAAQGTVSGNGFAPRALQAAAFTALRKMPGAEAEALLRRAAEDVSGPVSTRALAASVLSDRERLSEGATTLLIGEPIELPEDPIEPAPLPPPPPPPTPGRYNTSWTRLLGNTDLGVEFPGGVDVVMPPAASNVTAYAYQQANARLFGASFPVVKGELRSFRDGNELVFGAYLSIANNLIRRQFEQRLPCAITHQGNLFSGTAQFLDVTTKIPVFAVITLDLNIRASGSFTLDWYVGADVCPIVAGRLEAGIVPRAWVTAQASAYLDIVVARGGATLTATLLNTSVPAKATLAWSLVSTPSVSFCMDIRVTTQPLSGALDVWADVLVPTWYPPFVEWSRVGSARLWEFGTPAWSYPLLVKCF